MDELYMLYLVRAQIRSMFNISTRSEWDTSLASKSVNKRNNIRLSSRRRGCPWCGVGSCLLRKMVLDSKKVVCSTRLLPFLPVVQAILQLPFAVAFEVRETCLRGTEKRSAGTGTRMAFQCASGSVGVSIAQKADHLSSLALRLMRSRW